ncbi:hypothetical protein GCM10007913_41380 [Devosia yakushimensis]|uniref:Ankyrin repeat domain-containing protein n=2 Tax=Devosia yakushimensis TaxID=470028 RepID=A0ABQ5ULZ8_9HYPH|nr:hypothetical protein GCM10007913_41380 [Devosia yakushimensis]
MVRSWRSAALAVLVGLIMGGAAMANDLITAARQGDIATVAAQIAAGTDLEARDGDGATALLAATHANQIEAARLLIEAGADVNAKDAIADSPYLYAGARGHLEILKLTLAHGADLKSINRYGGTALIPAAERGHVETVATLIAAGVAVDHVNRLGWTALLEAIILGNGGPSHVAIVKLLLDAGADPNLADGDGVSPLAHARSRGFDEMVQMLEAAGGR